jgi:hypothetical protein
VADGAGAFELGQDVAVENVSDMAHPAMRDQRLAVGRDDAGGFLPAMLQRVETQVCEVGCFGVPIHAKHPALFVEAVEIRLLAVDHHFQL